MSNYENTVFSYCLHLTETFAWRPKDTNVTLIIFFFSIYSLRQLLPREPAFFQNYMINVVGDHAQMNCQHPIL